MGARPRFLPRLARSLGTLSLAGLVFRIREELVKYLRTPGVLKILENDV